MDELEKAAYAFMNPLDDRERLESMMQNDIIQAIEDGFDGQYVRRDVILKDVNWLIEQSLKVERLESALKLIIKNTVSGHVENIAKKALGGNKNG